MSLPTEKHEIEKVLKDYANKSIPVLYIQEKYNVSGTQLCNFVEAHGGETRRKRFKKSVVSNTEIKSLLEEKICHNLKFVYLGQEFKVECSDVAHLVALVKMCIAVDAEIKED